VPVGVDREEVLDRLKTSLKRGENGTLLLGSAEEVKREVEVGRLFEERAFIRQEGLSGALSLNEHTLWAAEQFYDEGVIRRFIESKASSLILPLTGGKEVTVEVDQVVSRGEHTYTLVGQVEGDSFSEVVLVFHDGTVAGSVAFHDQNAHYEYGEAGNGLIAVRQLDPTTYDAPCGQAGEVLGDEVIPEGMEISEEFPELQSGQVDADALGGSGTTITVDTVVGYGSEARIADGGTAAIEARIMTGVDRLNTSLQNSGATNVVVELRGMIEDPGYVFPGVTAGTMSSSDELGDLDNESDGVLDAVTDLKNTLGADHAAFVVKQADGSAGVAYRPGDAMIVARTYITSTRLTFAHEFGHNFGCQHAWGDTTSANSLTSHNYGWRLDPPSSTRVRTIMAYDWSWGSGSRITHFSNPAVQYNGANTGAVDGYDARGDATADPRAVSGGYEGSLGFGYDGTNASLGARNGDYIATNAITMANRQDRPGGDIAVAEPTRAGDLVCGDGALVFNSTGVGNNPQKVLTIINRGDLSLSSMAVSLSGADAAEFSVSSLTTTALAVGASTSVTVTFTPASTGLRSAVLHITSDDMDEPSFDIDLIGGMRTVLQQDSFEAGLGNWSNSTGYDFNWSRDSAGTFIYHMAGSNMGSLFVDLFDGSTWTLGVWSRSNAQHKEISDQWSYGSVDLSAYNNSAGLIVRFRGETGSSWSSDIAIDGVWVEAALAVDCDYELWASSYGLSGADAVPGAVLEADGLTNLLKYAFNFSPLVNDGSVLPVGGSVGVPRYYMTTGASENLAVEYVRRTGDSKISYEVLFSDDLLSSSWSADGVEASTTVINADYERVVVVDTFTTGTKGKRFVRLKVSYAAP